MNRAARMLGTALTLAVSLSLSSTVFAAEPMKNPSSQDLVNALAPSGAKGGLTTRGIAPSGAGAPAKPAAQPSASLDIKFGFNSAQLTPEAGKTLDELAKALKSEQLKKSSFAIIGHTDAKGSAGYNQKLSERRAQAVKDYLAKSGVESGRLEAQGKGQSALLDPANPTADANRRVEVVNRGT